MTNPFTWEGPDGPNELDGLDGTVDLLCQFDEEEVEAVFEAFTNGDWEGIEMPSLPASPAPAPAPSLSSVPSLSSATSLSPTPSLSPAPPTPRVQSTSPAPSAPQAQPTPWTQPTPWVPHTPPDQLMPWNQPVQPPQAANPFQPSDFGQPVDQEGSGYYDPFYYGPFMHYNQPVYETWPTYPVQPIVQSQQMYMPCAVPDNRPQQQAPNPPTTQTAQTFSFVQPTVPTGFVANPNNHGRWEYDRAGNRRYLNAPKDKKKDAGK